MAYRFIVIDNRNDLRIAYPSESEINLKYVKLKKKKLNNFWRKN